MRRGCYGSWLRSCAASIKNLNEEKNVDRAGTSQSVLKGAPACAPGVYRGVTPHLRCCLCHPMMRRGTSCDQ